MFLFTYGTLMQGESRAGIMENLGFVKLCDYKAEGYLMFHNFHGKYPIIFKSTDKNDTVIGEIYQSTYPEECDEEIISLLDGVEGVGVMYHRDTISAVVNDEVVHPYIYVGNYEYWEDYLNEEYGIFPLVNNLKWSQKFFE